MTPYDTHPSLRYDLAMSVSPLPGKFGNLGGKLVSFVPRFCLVNCTGAPLHVLPSLEVVT